MMPHLLSSSRENAPLFSPSALLASLANEPEHLSIIDVRSPCEFVRGHVPGASNLPLFSDEERVEVGLTYRRRGKEAAVLEGLSLIGPKMRRLAEGMLQAAKQGPLLIMCARGGMRSASMTWLAEQVGLAPIRLDGGYKAFRQVILEQFQKPLSIRLLGGETGSSKTVLLHCLMDEGARAIDLEGLAHHKGSAFGGLGQPEQPSQQLFENRLGVALAQVAPEEDVWLESESRAIGRLHIPNELWAQMQRVSLLRLQVPLSQRVEHLMGAEEYGECCLDALREGVLAIEKRLGPQGTQTALRLLEAGDLRGCCELLLREYYDKLYRHSMGKRPHVVDIPWDGIDHGELIERLRAMP